MSLQNIENFLFLWYKTAKFVASLPEPAVVGIAIIGNFEH